MIRRCACILLAEYRSLYPQYTIDNIAELASKSLNFDLSQCRDAIGNMLNYGSYYRNMEKAIGKGVTLALGITHAESSYAYHPFLFPTRYLIGQVGPKSSQRRPKNSIESWINSGIRLLGDFQSPMRNFEVASLSMKCYVWQRL